MAVGNPVVHIAPIASGCLGSCRLRARDTRAALESGCREIWVTAEDTAAYSWVGVGLPGLLEGLSGLHGRYFIRVGMMTPNQTIPILDPLLEAYRSDRVFKFIHIPVQAGSDDVLKRMGRRYMVDDYRVLVCRFREEVPSVSISTDIICGFPGSNLNPLKPSFCVPLP